MPLRDHFRGRPLGFFILVIIYLYVVILVSWLSSRCQIATFNYSEQCSRCFNQSIEITLKQLFSYKILLYLRTFLFMLFFHFFHYLLLYMRWRLYILNLTVIIQQNWFEGINKLVMLFLHVSYIQVKAIKSTTQLWHALSFKAKVQLAIAH